MPDIKEKLVEVLKNNREHYLATYSKHLKSYEEYTADHLIANGVTIQRWISTEESLPEKEGFYLAHRKDDGWQHVEVIWYGRGCLWNYIWTHEVTHWMPLPAPPKEEV